MVSDNSPERRLWWLARWRDAYWRNVVERHRSDSDDIPILRLKFLAKGAIMTVGGILCSWIAMDPPYASNIVVKVLLALVVLFMLSGSGLIAIYFGLWSDSGRT